MEWMNWTPKGQEKEGKIVKSKYSQDVFSHCVTLKTLLLTAFNFPKLKYQCQGVTFGSVCPLPSDGEVCISGTHIDLETIPLVMLSEGLVFTHKRRPGLPLLAGFLLFPFKCSETK